ncbi:DUF1127 domain-containing protein [Ruegeria jejuensis]|uniref:DUF1127 domain-containing protein n=1 Tax=Ruegeria jejuensis TaxID=3233338 RepID=UPI00355BC177
MEHVHTMTSNTGLTPHLFSNSMDQKAARKKRAERKRKQREIWRLSDRELLDLGYSRSELKAIRHYHH